MNPNETSLVPSSINTSAFSKRFATAVDGKIYAEPVYMPNVTVVSGPLAGVHNLVTVCTQHDSVYAIDAQSGAIVWQTSFLASGLPGATTITSVPSTDTGSTDTSPEIGICSTPVIDPSTNYLYVVAKTKQIIGGNASLPHYVYTLNALDITNGNATANANIIVSTVIGNTTLNTGNNGYIFNTANSPTAPQDIFVVGTGSGAITVNGQSRVYFNTMRQMNRPGLRLYNGTLYIAFGSHGDNGPYHGWVLAYTITPANPPTTTVPTLTLSGVFLTTPNSYEGGIWGSGGAPVVDANGYIYVVTGNGKFDGYNNSGTTAGLNSLGFPVNGDYGDSVIKLAVDPTTSVGNQNINGWGLTAVDYFTPFNAANLDSSDADLGSGGITLLPPSAGSSAHPNLLVCSGKQGDIYLIDVSTLGSMGKFSATTDNVVQEQTVLGEVVSTPSFFNGYLYYAGTTNPLEAFAISNAKMSTTPIKSTDTFAFPGGTTSISANGTSSGIVWVVDNGTESLRAYPASNIATELWNSTQAVNNSDSLGTTQKFAAPSVADGLVFVPTASSLVEYGPIPSSNGAPAAPTNLTATAVSGLQVNLSWTDNSTTENGFAIEQSSDGINFGQIATVGTNVTTYSAEMNIAAGTGYYFRVRAFNGTSNNVYSNYTNVASIITPGYTPTLNYSSGFAGSTPALVYNGSAAIVNSRARITNGGNYQAGSVFCAAPQNIAKFTTSFTFQETAAKADGCAFVIQGVGSNALGGSGDNLGFGGLANSVAVKFDIYNNSGEGSDSTGLYTNGATPTLPATDLTATGIVLNSGDVMSVTISYNGTTLTEVITDTVTLATVTESYAVNIPAIVGANTAYIGFTGGTGYFVTTQDILSWTFSPLPTTAPAAPSALVATAASGTQVNLSWTSNSTNQAGFIIMRSTAGGAYMQAGVTGANVTTFTDTALVPNTSYSYEVCATNNVGNSGYSTAQSVVTPIPPATPTNAQPTAITTTTIAMSWTNNANNATGYNILRKMSSADNFSLVATLPPTATNYLDTNLTPNTSYDYHIQCFNVAGYSDFSGFTAVTLPTVVTLPIVTVSTPQAVAVNGVATGQITFSVNTPQSSPLTVNYTVATGSGSAVPGTDYTALSGSAIIPANATSVSVPVTALPGATPNAMVTVSIATTSAYTAGTPSSGTVVLESASFGLSGQNDYGTSSVVSTAGNNVPLTFQGLPGNPAGAVYVWYLNGAAFTTTTTPSYTITAATASQSGTYAVYAWAPGSPSAVLGTQAYTVTITSPGILTSTNAISVNDGSSNTFTVSLASAPAANTVVNVNISGTPNMTVSPATITMTPTSYQNQVVTVSAAAINSNDSNRSAVVTCANGSSSVQVNATDVISDAQTAANLTGISSPLTGSNIGTASAGDSSVHASGNLWVDGSGAGGLSGTADAFHLESQSVTGNFTMTVQLQNIVAYGATTPRAGLMIRDGTAAGSNFLAIAGNAASPSGYDLDSRTTVNGSATETVTSGTGLTYTYPAAYLMLTRVGNILHAFVSSNGVNYAEVTNPTTGVTWTGMSSAVSVGLFSSSASSANTRAVFSGFNVSVAPVLTDIDIGSPPIAGSGTNASGAFIVQGCGSDIWNNADQFNYDYQAASGNSSIIVHVDSQANTNVWAKAGPQFRTSLTAGSADYGVYMTPAGTVSFEYRDGTSATSYEVAETTPASAPRWLQIVRSGKVYTASYATVTGTPTAANWITVGTHTVATVPASDYVGLAVCSHNTAALCAAQFSQISINGSAITTPAPLPLPAAFVDLDVGSPLPAGSSVVTPTTISESGSGADIWTSADQFHYYYEPQPQVEDEAIVVQVSSIQNTNYWAKAGPMFRDTSAAGAMYIGLYENPNLQVEMQWRTATNTGANGGNQVGDTVNAKWLMLVKSDNTYTGYYATTTTMPTASQWVLVGSQTIYFNYANSTYLAGLAVCSHSPGQLCTAVFSGFSQ